MATTSTWSLPYPLSSGTVNVSGDIQSLAVAVDAIFSGVANFDIFSSAACTLTTTSATYVDIASASKSFTKAMAAADSDLVVWASLSGFSTAITTDFAVGCQVNGVDRDLTHMIFNTANTHQALPSGAVRITGLAAGAYTVKLRAKRNSGAGTLTIDTGDNVMFYVAERAVP